MLVAVSGLTPARRPKKQCEIRACRRSAVHFFEDVRAAGEFPGNAR